MLKGPLPASLALEEEGLAGRYGSLIEVAAYDLREIAAEKGRALLTRRTAKTRDLADLFLMETRKGIRLEDHLELVARKTEASVKAAARYRQNLQLIEGRFDFMRDDEAEGLMLKPLPEPAFRRYRERVLTVLTELARTLST